MCYTPQQTLSMNLMPCNYQLRKQLLQGNDSTGNCNWFSANRHTTKAHTKNECAQSLALTLYPDNTHWIGDHFATPCCKILLLLRRDTHVTYCHTITILRTQYDCTVCMGHVVVAAVCFFGLPSCIKQLCK